MNLSCMWLNSIDTQWRDSTPKIQTSHHDTPTPPYVLFKKRNLMSHFAHRLTCQSHMTVYLSSGPHSTVSHCPPNEYQCGGTELCIHMSKLCNGVPDCTDGWDEGPHCRGIALYILIMAYEHACCSWVIQHKCKGICCSHVIFVFFLPIAQFFPTSLHSVKLQCSPSSISISQYWMVLPSVYGGEIGETCFFFFFFTKLGTGLWWVWKECAEWAVCRKENLITIIKKYLNCRRKMCKIKTVGDFLSQNSCPSKFNKQNWWNMHMTQVK